MIVDDEPLACRLLSSYVERTDSLTLAGSFTSASRGLEAINSVVPDIAFLDIQMPEMSGIELAGRITAAGTRVVFTTAYPDFALEGFREMGCEIGTTSTPIIPLYIRDDYKTYHVTRDLFDEGLFVNPVVTPAVAPQDTLIRFSLMATHTMDQVTTALEKIQKVFRAHGIIA